MDSWKNGQNGKVVKAVIEKNFSLLEKEVSGLKRRYELTFTQSDWNENSIYIPYITHTIQNPCVNLYILQNKKYNTVYGGVSIDSTYNVTLETDLPFDGKVVIK